MEGSACKGWALSLQGLPFVLQERDMSVFARWAARAVDVAMAAVGIWQTRYGGRMEEARCPRQQSTTSLSDTNASSEREACAEPLLIAS